MSSALELYEVNETTIARGALTANEDELGAFDVLESHGWIEAGEVVRSQRFVVVARRNQVAFRATVRIVGRRHGLGWKNFEWNAGGTAFTDQAPTQDIGVLLKYDDGGVYDESKSTVSRPGARGQEKVRGDQEEKGGTEKERRGSP